MITPATSYPTPRGNGPRFPSATCEASPGFTPAARTSTVTSPGPGDGTSYGTYVAERYALAYPRHVAKLVLDSVVPHEASGQLEAQAFPRVAQVLRKVCGGCSGDLAAVIASGYDGTALLDTIVAYSVFDPTYRGIPQALLSARRGDDLALLQLINGIESAERSMTTVP